MAGPGGEADESPWTGSAISPPFSHRPRSRAAGVMHDALPEQPKQDSGASATVPRTRHRPPVRHRNVASHKKTLG